MKRNLQSVVFDMFETGLGVGRSLGQKGVEVTGVGYRKDIGWYSRYVSPLICPHPIQNEIGFIDWIHKTFSDRKNKIPVFLTSDDFLITFSRNREILSNYFLFNLADHSLLESISNKYAQFQIAKNAGIDLPATWLISKVTDLEKIPYDIHFPVFLKGQDVNSWRKVMGGTIKGFLVNNYQELNEKIKETLIRGIPVILQEVIEGPDTNHFKYCSYTTPDGEILAEFTLQKIRQNPIHFGVGAVVESIHKPELIEQGRRLFSGIGFKGIGSAEFKFDDRDGKLKLIEINPRYWQQNYLSTACGMNFAYLNYLDLMKESPVPVKDFKPGIKWVNRYMDFDSFVMYKKEGVLNFHEWRRSLKGKKVYPDFMWSDPLPFFYEIDFGRKLYKIPYFLWKKLFK